eukprot:TRINITY_DN53962_c0_g1_i1.p1 TRINITY_DN53962_c0_g1~~TRINITY_DN53962_c0_g1_i1.p1  ORF type:complete len:154 (-),score=26.80 TRINITY_DN53962_c0_g1_i1:94-555(-)
MAIVAFLIMVELALLGLMCCCQQVASKRIVASLVGAVLVGILALAPGTAVELVPALVGAGAYLIYYLQRTRFRSATAPIRSCAADKAFEAQGDSSEGYTRTMQDALTRVRDTSVFWRGRCVEGYTRLAETASEALDSLALFVVQAEAPVILAM